MAPGVLGIQEPFEKVKVHVLNDSVETFESMPANVMIESVDGQFSKEVRVRTCPRNVTGNYRVKDWSKQQSRWPHVSLLTSIIEFNQREGPQESTRT